jgi:hypothetical protein
MDLPGGSKTLTVSPYGNMVMIDDSYELVFSDLRNEGSSGALPMPLPVDCSRWHQRFKDGKFNNIEFNAEGDMLLVYNERSVGFIAIPTKNAPDGSFDASMMELNPCSFSELLADNDVVRDGSVKVVKVAFHPLSSYHVVILLSNNTLLLTDTLSDVSREFILRPSVSSSSPVKGQQSQHGGKDGGANKGGQFVSFCFGGDYDWMKLAVLLLTADGQVYFLCPLLPSGAVVPKIVIDGLYAWVEEEVTPKAASVVSANVASYLSKEMRAYLDVMFSSSSSGSGSGSSSGSSSGSGSGSSSGSSSGSEGNNSGSGIFNNEIGEYTQPLGGGGGGGGGDARSSSVAVEADDEVLWGSYAPMLQGPLRKLGAAGDGASWSHSHTFACDVCTPGSGSAGSAVERAPVVMVAFANGTVDMYTAHENSVGAFMWPMWPALAKPLGTANTGAVTPTMRLVETVSTSSSSAASMGGIPRWSLTNDPIYCHYFHLSNAQDGSAYLVICNWLSKMMKSASEASSRAMDANADGDDTPSSSSSSSWDVEASGVCRVLDRATYSASASTDRHCGSCVVSDSMMGHMAIHRGADGAVTRTNVTTCARLYQYQQLIEKGSEQGAKKGADSMMRQYEGMGMGSFQRRSQLLIETIQKGLETVPTVPAGDDYDDSLDATKKKHLLAASKHLNQHAILPLEDLAHRIISALDGVKDIYDDQVRFLEGPGGFKNKLWDLNNNQKVALTDRIDKIGTRLLQQRTRSRELLSQYAAQNARRATMQERAYSKQLGEWRSQLGAMQSQLTSLGGMVKVCSGEVLLHADGRSSSKGSFKARHNSSTLESPSQTSSSFSQSRFGSPAPMSPSPAKHGGNTNTAMFQSPRVGEVSVVSTANRSSATGGGSSSKNMTPLQRRRAGGSIGNASVSRLTNRMSSLNVTSTSSPSPLTPLGRNNNTNTSIVSVAGSTAPINASSLLASSAYESTLSAEEVTFANDLIKAQTKVISDSEAQLKALDLLCLELKDQMSQQQKGRSSKAG